MSNVSKGSRYELKARKMFEENEYKVDFKYRTRFHKETDLFGLWDFVAINKNGLLFVQVKTNMNEVSRFKTKSKSFMREYGNLPIEFLIVCFIPRQKEPRTWGWYQDKWVEL